MATPHDSKFDSAVDHLLDQDPDAPGNFACRVRHAGNSFPDVFCEELAALMVRHRVTRVIAAVRIAKADGPAD